MVTPQQYADEQLAKYQKIRREYPDQLERVEAMFAEFFAPPPPCDVEYSATERRVAEIMANG